MADWMANAICDADMKQDKKIKEIRNYIFSFAKEMGFEDYTKYDDELGKYYATADMDEEPSTRQLIERYDEYLTWDEIASWLGERDFFRKYSLEEIKNMTSKEYFINSMECEEVWAEELAKYGIQRLKIDENSEKAEK